MRPRRRGTAGPGNGTAYGSVARSRWPGGGAATGPAAVPVTAALVLAALVLGACGGTAGHRHAAAPGTTPVSAASAAGSVPAAPRSAPAARASVPAAPATLPLAVPSAAGPAIGAVERRFHAHVGLYLLDTGTGRSVAYRASRRFAHCSTVKVLAAGALLRRESAAGLGSVITYGSARLVAHSPVTSRHAGRGMRLDAVIAAALEYSDNTAENLMVQRLGGPAGLRREVRALGDVTTRVDRTEPALNEAAPGDVRDTSTARALVTDLRALLLGPVLAPGRRALLVDWMTRNTTGGPYIRAAVPRGWTVADKTGSGGYGTRDDIAVAWPPFGAPVVISVLTDRGTPGARSDDALIAQVVRAGLAVLGPAPPGGPAIR